MNRLILSAILLLFAVSCKKDAQIDPPDEPGGSSGNANTVKVQVQVPAGSVFNPAGSSLLSSFRYVNVEADNYAHAYADTSKFTMAYVFNKDNKLVMAGFITDSSKIISPATTAKVLLHWGLKFSFLQQNVTEAYINNIDKIEAAREWISKFETLFKADPFVIANSGFKNDLKIAIEKIRDRRTLDINGKNASDVQVDANDIKSGLQVFEDGLSKISVNNTYRRRGHAFLYKMKVLDANGSTNVIQSQIVPSSSSHQDAAIDPRSAVNSVMGEVGKYVESYTNPDAGTASFSVKSGPIDIALLENENEVTYKFRVIGPGVRGRLLTKKEDDRLTQLEAETFFFDLVVPAIGTITSIGGMFDKPNINATAKERAIATVQGWWKAMPDVYEECKKGNYENALKKFLESLYKDAAGNYLNEACTIIGDMYNVDSKKLLAGGIGKLNMILTGFDAVLSVSDAYLILADCASSNAVEEWEVKARTSKVSLTPDEQATVISSQKTVTAIIKNLNAASGTHPNFEWSTSGKYGYLKDTKGHTGTSFESIDDKIFYNCNATSSQLSDGDNWEYIYIKAYYAGQLIGMDTAKINVRKLEYKMMPDNVTLTGKKNTNNNEVRLYLVRQDNVVDIAPNSQLDYKVIWSTAGKYGKLLGRETEASTTVTDYDYNSSWYTVTDDKTKEATETITARIYVKAKDDADYHLMDEVTSSVRIDNDERKKVIRVKMTYMNGCWNEGNCYTYPVAVFPLEDTAVKYKVMFYNFTGTSANSPEGRTYSWSKGGVPPTTYSTYPETKDVNGGNYYICLGRTWCAGPTAGCNMGSTAEWVSNYNRLYGTGVMAEVTYYY